MVEWLKAPVLKTGDMKVSVGSNPTLSAKKEDTSNGRVLLFTAWIFVEWDSKGGFLLYLKHNILTVFKL